MENKTLPPKLSTLTIVTSQQWESLAWNPGVSKAKAWSSITFHNYSLCALLG